MESVLPILKTVLSNSSQQIKICLNSEKRTKQTSLNNKKENTPNNNKINSQTKGTIGIHSTPHNSALTTTTTTTGNQSTQNTKNQLVYIIVVVDDISSQKR
jgi:hypothetical protein